MNIDDKKLEIIYDTTISKIKDFVEKNNFDKVVLGLSGGIDSALVAALLSLSLGSKNVYGVLMPSQYSTDHSLDDAKKIAENLEIKTITTPIKNIYSSYLDIISHSINESDLDNDMKSQIDVFDVSFENLQSRIRATILMTLSNKYNMMLINTGNRSEFAMGYSTLYGDLCGMLSPIGDIYKTEVFALSYFINKKFNKEIIPLNSIEKPPSAELRDNQKDSDSLPDYNFLDDVLNHYLDFSMSKKDLIEKYSNEEQIEFIINKYKSQEFKRKLAPYIIELRYLIDKK